LQNKYSCNHEQIQNATSGSVFKFKITKRRILNKRFISQNTMFPQSDEKVHSTVERNPKVLHKNTVFRLRKLMASYFSIELGEVLSEGILQIHHACRKGFKGGGWG
jgi:hypothetical protein